MGNAITLQSTGLSELKALLRQLPANISQNVLRGAARAGARVIEDAIIAKAPVFDPAKYGADPRVMPGVLKNSVYMKHDNALSNELQQIFFVGIRRGRKERARGRDAFYWTWVEFGHHVVPRVAKGGAKLSERRAALASATGLAGSSYVLPHPFFRPATVEAKQTASDSIRDYMAKRIPVEFSKLRLG